MSKTNKTSAAAVEQPATDTQKTTARAKKKRTKVTGPKIIKDKKQVRKNTQTKPKSRPAIDWPEEVKAIKKDKLFPLSIDMGTPGSAQVTRVRLLSKDYCKGLAISTRGKELIFEKAKRGKR